MADITKEQLLAWAEDDQLDRIRAAAANVAVGDSADWTWLVDAVVDEGLLGALLVLRELGARASAWDVEAGNALHVAADGGHARMVPVLVEMGADPNAVRHDRGHVDYPLAMALRRDDLETAEALLAAGADPNIELSLEPPSDFAESETGVFPSFSCFTKEAVQLMVRFGARFAPPTAAEAADRTWVVARYQMPEGRFVPNAPTPIAAAARAAAWSAVRELVEQGLGGNPRSLTREWLATVVRGDEEGMSSLRSRVHAPTEADLAEATLYAINSEDAAAALQRLRAEGAVGRHAFDDEARSELDARLARTIREGDVELVGRLAELGAKAREHTLFSLSRSMLDRLEALGAIDAPATDIALARCLQEDDIAGLLGLVDQLDLSTPPRTRFAGSRPTTVDLAVARGADRIGAELVRRGARWSPGTPQQAARQGMLGALEAMLDAGLPPNHNHLTRGGLLAGAIVGAQLETVELLIGRGADPGHDVEEEYLATDGDEYPRIRPLVSVFLAGDAPLEAKERLRSLLNRGRAAYCPDEG